MRIHRWETEMRRKEAYLSEAGWVKDPQYSTLWSKNGITFGLDKAYNLEKQGRVA